MGALTINILSFERLSFGLKWYLLRCQTPSSLFSSFLSSVFWWIWRMHASEHGTLEWPQKSKEKKKERSRNILLFPPSSTCANDQYTPCKPNAPLLHLQYYCGYKKYNILQTISETLHWKELNKINGN